MKKKEAKKLTIKVWTYLAKHPEIRRKPDLPKDLFLELKNLRCHCPLCESLRFECSRCPLKNCTSTGDVYDSWERALCDKDRTKYAKIIVKKTKRWVILPFNLSL